MAKSELFFKNLNNFIHTKLYNKYFINEEMNNIFLIDKIIYNEKCRLVCLFKEFLIYEDDFEFLKKYYNYNNAIKKLNTYLEYYQKYSILFPNYSSLPESKYIYKNIFKKQRMVDNLEIIQKKEKQKAKANKKFEENINSYDDEGNNNKGMFNSNTYASILRNSQNGCISIFGLSNNKDEENNISMSLIEYLIRKIENNDKDKIQEKDNFQIKYKYIIEPINLINNNKTIKKLYTTKGNKKNAIKNIINMSLNTNKLNTLNNCINANNKIFHGNKLYVNK